MGSTRTYFPIIILFFALAAPVFALAGSQTYSTPGTYTFTVPAYGTLTVEVFGAGGGGGGGGAFGGGSDGEGNGIGIVQLMGGSGYSGTDGTSSAFGNVTGYGGGGGGGASGGYLQGDGGDGIPIYGANGAAGLDGAAANGDSNTTGGGSAGGIGGNCYVGCWGGTGGAGGYARKSYSTGQLSGSVTVTVGAGGAGGEPAFAGGGAGNPGNGGEVGIVKITWTEPASCPNGLNIAQYPSCQCPSGQVQQGSACVTPAATTCTVTFDKNPVAPGESTTMHWQVQNAPTGAVWFTIANYGPASASGQTQVSNNQSTDYTGRVYAGTADNLVATCPATLEVTAQNNTERYSCRSNQCTLDDNGAYASLSSCTSVCHQQCPAGRVWNPSTRQCEAQCPSGFIWDGTQCVSQCPAGTVWDPAAGQCKDENQCRSVRFCRGTDAYLGDPGKAVCPASFLERCEWGCSGGACLQPPQPVLSLSAIPSLVRHGDTTTVSWSAQNVRPNSCTVSGTNGDSWTQQNGDRSWSGEAASAIPVRTVFTLSCTDLRSRGVSVTRIVNVIPVWGER